ncbi:GumC family protein [Rhizorhapis sp.]|uniref:GumC family protein n=1 Tax=Rhizorhapis sp. TaxID=1968842 RepID=UPI002B48AD80|nr:Wzz/FepE/Etk N-terminal domain-containing protein [Rhizorhapis sp.]HKR16053.1 Wzz/FepE/Etk N-terminal domain-containing protein [Rhizorhapis sp.]
MSEEVGDMPTSFVTPSELLAILYRRFWWITTPALLGTAAAGAMTLFIEPQYQSTANLLIASQEVPTTLVASPFDTYADERIAKIRQQILSRANVVRLIKDLNLYPEEREALPSEEVQNRMRSAVGVNLVSASDTNNAGQGARTTIAFSLSFTYGDPATAQAVADRLTHMFIGEDKRQRIEQASDTAHFLARRGNELRDRLVELDQKRREIQARYSGALPDQVALSAQSSSALRAEISRMDAEAQGIMQQNSILAARGAELTTTANATPESVRRAEDRLLQLTSVYTDEHPDVMAARAALAAERAGRRRNAAPQGVAVISSEIAAGRNRVTSLSQRRAHLIATVGEIDRISALAPQAAYELNNLERDYDNLKQQYQDIREKQLEAQVAANLQREGKGEHFSIVDPANWPLRPISPNPKHLVVLGLAGGLALGAGLVLILEMLGGLINGQAAIQRLTGVRPLAVVPMLSADGPAGIIALLRRLLPGGAKI